MESRATPSGGSWIRIRWAVAVAVVAVGFLASAAEGPAQVGSETEAGSEAAADSVPPADTIRELERQVMADSTYDRMYRLGVAYLDSDRAQEAARLFERCIALEPDRVKPYVNLGASLDAIGHGAEARRHYRRALEINPYDEIALCRLGASLYASNLRAAAMDTLRLTIEKHPRSYCAYFTLGVAFADAQIYREAIRAWEKVMEFAPESPEALSAKESIATLRQILQTP